MTDLNEVLHVAPHLYVLQCQYGKKIMSFEDVADRQFVKATKKMIALMKKEG